MTRLRLVSLLALVWADPAVAQDLAQSFTQADPTSGANAAGTAFAPSPPPFTNIEPDVAPERSLNTNVSQVDNVYTIDGGSRAGNNLFHSFALFDLAAGDLARWVHSVGDPDTIANVVNRVTGGSPSHLFGTLDSTAIPNADFWFINPAGIVFGDGAQINVPATAHFSTASELRFASGPAFSVAAPDGSTLNIAAPQAFGFIGNEGGILLSGVGPGFLPNGDTLVLTAGDVTIEDSDYSAGGLIAAAVGATAAEVGSDGGSVDPLAGALMVTNSSVTVLSNPVGAASIFLGGGSVAVTSSNLSTGPGSSSAGGPILIRAEDGVTVAGSSLSTTTIGASDAGDIELSGSTIAIADSTLRSDSTNDLNDAIPGRAGSIIIAAADTLETTNMLLRSKATCSAADCVSGDSGIISLFGSSVLLFGTVAVTTALPPGSDRGIMVVAPGDLLVQDSVLAAPGGVTLSAGGNLDLVRSELFASTFGTRGSPGAVILWGTDIHLDSSFLTAESFSTDSFATPGLILIDAMQTLRVETSTISSDTFGRGDAGSIILQGADIAVANSFITSGSHTEATIADPGNAGSIILQADGNLSVSASILTSDASCFGDGCANGDAGAISLSGDSVELAQTILATSVGDTGSSGGIFVTSLGNLTVVDSTAFAARGLIALSAVGELDLLRSSLVASSFGFGDQPGGAVFLEAGNVSIDSSFIAVDDSSTGGATISGQISIAAANDLRLANGTQIILDTTGNGDGGDVTLAANTIDISNSVISSSSHPDVGVIDPGDAGDIHVDAVDSLTMTNSSLGSAVSCNGIGCVSGNGGRISLTGSFIDIEGGDLKSFALGTGNAGSILLQSSGQLILTFTTLNSDSLGSGASGNVLISALGDASVSTSDISATTFGSGLGGTVTIRSLADLDLLDTSVSSSTAGPGDAGSVSLAGAQIDVENSLIQSASFETGAAGVVTVEATGLTLGNSMLASGAFGSGKAGSVDIRVSNNLVLRDGASISSSTSQGSGSAGQVQVQADSIELENQSNILSQTQFTSTGDAGSVAISGNSLAISSGSFISSSSRTVGDAGDVTIDVGTIHIADSGSISSQAGPDATGSAGLVTIRADTLTVNGFIDTTSFGPGAAGSVRIDGDTINVSGGAISSTAVGEGAGGLVQISADSLLVADGGRVISSTIGAGDAGGVTIDAGTAVVQGIESSIASQASFGSTGNAGFVSIVADSLTVRDGGSINTSSSGPGAAGAVQIDAATVTVSGGGIESLSEESGNAGLVEITAGSLLVTNFGVVSSSTFGDGAGGDVILDVGTIDVKGFGSLITSQAQGTGNAGSVQIRSNMVTVSGGSINSANAGSGDGGLVQISSDSLLLTDGGRLFSSTFGVGAAGRVILDVGTAIVQGSRSSIASLTAPESTGNAGTISILADTLTIRDQGFVSTATNGAGDAGFIDIRVANNLVIENEGAVSSETFSTGDAGFVTIATDKLTLRSSGTITSSTFGLGDAGRVSVNGRLIQVDGGGISSSAALAGTSGALDIIAAELLEISGGGSIATESGNPNAAGLISISAPRVTISGLGSQISSANLSDGPCPAGQCAAGLVSISTLGEDAEGIFLSDGGTITTSSSQGPAGNIELLMAPQTLLILQGATDPAVIETSSGPGTGGVITIARPLAIISNGGRISALGQSGGANVRIDTPFFIASADRQNIVEVSGVLEFSNAITDVSAGTVTDDFSILDASGVLRGQCTAQRMSGAVSQLTFRDIGPYAPEPTAGRLPQVDTSASGTGDCL